MGTDLFGRPSTADTGERNDHDYYETPAWMTRSLLHHHPGIVSPWPVFEPCAGDGAIARVLRQAGCIVITNDIDTRHATDLHGDASRFELWEHTAISDQTGWIITNPPFNVAFPILEQALLLADIGVAMLLRKTFLEPTKERGAWLAKHPPTRVIGLPRHNFRGKGSDSCAADWFIWEINPDRSLAPFVIDHCAKGRTA